MIKKEESQVDSFSEVELDSEVDEDLDDGDLVEEEAEEAVELEDEF